VCSFSQRFVVLLILLVFVRGVGRHIDWRVAFEAELVPVKPKGFMESFWADVCVALDNVDSFRF
jgi:hypothetical protein